MTTHSRPAGCRPRNPPYRITLVGNEWHVTRPHATMDHAFVKLADAEAFVRSDSGENASFVEVVAGGTYMVKQLHPVR